MQLEERILSFIRSDLMSSSDEQIGPEDSLIECGLLDSIALVQVIAFLEAEAGVTVPDQEVIPDNFDTVKRIAEFVARLKSS